MAVKRSSVGHFPCSIARALDVVGEWWTPLVLRDVFLGRRRFEEIQSDLGIARNILSDRLATLVEHGVLERVRYQEHPERFEYRLTPMGADLFGVLMSLMAWGDRWLSPDGPPATLVHQQCGNETHAVVVCECCGEPLHARDTTVSFGAATRR